MKKAQILTVVLLMSAVSGCGTVLSRPKPAVVQDGLYPATRTDGTLIWAGVTTGNCFFKQKGERWLYDAMGYTVIPLCFAVDIPFSIVTDTVMLPFDIYRTKAR